MGLESLSDESLLAKKRKVKTILRVFIIIWSILIVGFLVFTLFVQKSQNYTPISWVPFLVGPITLFPLIQQNRQINQELKKRNAL